MITRVELWRALQAGAAAARDGRRVLDCPHSAVGLPRERALARYWIRGYTRVNPPPIDESSDEG